MASDGAQGTTTRDYYWKSHLPGYGYFTAVPFGLTYAEMNAWIRHGGGQELWDELAGEFGLKAMWLVQQAHKLEVGSTKINSADDFKGLKMRIPQFWVVTLSVSWSAHL